MSFSGWHISQLIISTFFVASVVLIFHSGLSLEFSGSMGSRDDSPPVAPVLDPQPSMNPADLAVRPVCRVKRFANRLYRSSPIAPSTPTESLVSNSPIPSVTPPLSGRWDEGHLSASYRPQAFGRLQFGGLQPPSLGPSAPHPRPLSVGGLQFQPRPLGVFRFGMQTTLSSGLFPQVQRSPTFHPPMMGLLLHAGTSDLVSAVFSSGSSAMTMSTMHDHLKAQHLRQWLLLLDSASTASTLVCSTVDSEFA